MYISNIPMEPSALSEAYQEEITLGGVFGSLATGSFRIGLIILGNILAGVVCYYTYIAAKRFYRAATGRDPQATGGLIVIAGFGILGLAEWLVLELVGCEVHRLKEVQKLEDPAARLFERTCDGILPLIVFYLIVTKLYSWHSVKSSLSSEERRAIPQQFGIGSILLIIADFGYYLAEQSSQFAAAQDASKWSVHAFVVILLALASRSYLLWFRALKRAYEHRQTQSPVFDMKRRFSFDEENSYYH